MWERTQTARKEHTCAGCGNPILAGERYDIQVNPPWEDCEPDADEEGRTIWYLRPESDRRWGYQKWHRDCWTDYRYRD